MNEDLRNTRFFQTIQEDKMDVNQVLDLVYTALSEKEYDPVNQIVGYVISRDPTYVTNHKNTHSLIMEVERGNILELLLSYYIRHKIDRH